MINRIRIIYVAIFISVAGCNSKPKPVRPLASEVFDSMQIENLKKADSIRQYP